MSRHDSVLEICLNLKSEWSCSKRLLLNFQMCQKFSSNRIFTCFDQESVTCHLYDVVLRASMLCVQPDDGSGGGDNGEEAALIDIKGMGRMRVSINIKVHW